MHSTLTPASRWTATYLLCLGSLMIVLDGTIVNVALPSIRADLGFSDTGLVWVVNAYLLTFGGFLLLGGRLGDLYGHRRMFLIGIALFTLASAACGLAPNQAALVIGRAVQGFGGAVVSAVALSLVATMFPEPDERAKAMGFFGFVEAGGGSIGAVLGGLLTAHFTWHWIFLVNLPIGIAVYLAGRNLLPARGEQGRVQALDYGGAVTVTTALLFAVFGVVNGNDAGWLSIQTLGVFTGAIVCFAAFVLIEMRVAAPLVPLGFLRSRNIAVSNVVGVLWAAGMFAWFFISAQYLQLVLHYGPMAVGLAFVPSSLLMAVFSLGLSAKLIERFGIRKPLVAGLAIAAAGLAAFANARVNGSLLVDVLPGMLLLGLGAGIGFNPILMAAMEGATAEDAGIASGIVNTSFMMGGALGLAILASVAAARTHAATALGLGNEASLNAGYQLAFLTGAIIVSIAAMLSAIGLPVGTTSSKSQT